MGLSGKMRRTERQVQEEGILLVRLDEGDRLLDEIFRQPAVVEGIGLQFPAPPELLGLVVALVDEVSQVEPLAHGVQLRSIAQVPFPDQGGLVSGLLEHLPHGPGLRSQSVVGLQPVTDHAPVPAQARRISPREQSHARWRAHRGARIKTSQSQTFRRQFIENGGLLPLAPVAGQIVVSQVIRHHENDVGRVRAGQNKSIQRQAKQGKKESLGHSISLANARFQCSKESGARSRKEAQRETLPLRLIERTLRT